MIGRAAAVIDSIKQFVQTDLTPVQQLALATLFHKTAPDSIRTASLPGIQAATIDGVSYVVPDDFKKAAAVDWLLKGEPDGMNRLLHVDLKDASGDPDLYQQVYDCLRHYGFEVRRCGRAPGNPLTTSRVVQGGLLKGAGRRVIEVLGLDGRIEKSPLKNAPDVVLYAGKDLADSAVVGARDSWPAIPVRPSKTLLARFENAPARRRSGEVPVDIKAVGDEQDGAGPDNNPSAESDLEKPGLDNPAAADSQPSPPTQTDDPKDPKPPSDDRRAQ